MKNYRTVVGLEIHVELSTASKMFSAAPNDPFHAAPNTNLTPICIGMPGTLPVANREAIRRTLLLGLALGCRIPQESKFDRKHYFYPDLPKGYQISQYDQPFCQGGELTVGGERVGLTRIHLEEDAGKLLHPDGQWTQVDLNRAGVALVEIVTEPDIKSPEQARSFLQELRQLVRTLRVADADMEKGQLRCDANVSIDFEFEGKEVSSYISEIKNLNSFRMVERAIAYEAERLYKEWQSDPKARGQKHKITVGWDDARGVTKLQRRKEGAADYRYFPEPDIPAFRIYDAAANDPRPAGVDAFDLAELRQELPELPAIRRERWQAAGIKVADGDILVGDGERGELLDRILSLSEEPKERQKAASYLVHEFAPGVTAEQYVAVAKLAQAGQIDSNVPKLIFQKLKDSLASGDTLDVTELVAKEGWGQNSDEGAIRSVVEEVLAAHPAQVKEYQTGKTALIGFFIGQTRAKAGNANPELIKRLLLAALE